MSNHNLLGRLSVWLKAHKKQMLLTTLVLVIALPLVKRHLNKNTLQAAPVAARVQVATANYQKDFQQGFNTTTSLKANADVVLKTKVESNILQSYVEKGQTVEAGALLIELEHRNQSAQVEAAQAQIDINVAAANAAAAQKENAAVEQQRYDTLIAKGYATRQEVDAKRTTKNTAESDYHKAASSIDYARAQLLAAQATLSDYYLQAPFAGIVLEDYDLHSGSKVAKDTSVLRLADIATMKASISIPENLLQSIKPGMSVTLTCDSLPGQKFTGILQVISPYINTDTHMVQADVHIDNAAVNYVLKPGMFAKVSVIQQALPQALVIPKEALRSDNTVLVVKNNKVQPLAVQLSFSNDKEIAITQGLTPGDLVVISGGRNLKAGDEVAYEKP